MVSFLLYAEPGCLSPARWSTINAPEWGTGRGYTIGDEAGRGFHFCLSPFAFSLFSGRPSNHAGDAARAMAALFSESLSRLSRRRRLADLHRAGFQRGACQAAIWLADVQRRRHDLRRQHVRSLRSLVHADPDAAAGASIRGLGQGGDHHLQEAGTHHADRMYYEAAW